MRRLKNSTLFRSVLAVAGGTAAAQAVAFAFSPLITRIYGPEAFGLQAVFLSLISIFGPAIALRYPMTVVIAENEVDARHLGRLSLMIALVLSCFVGLALLVGHGPILAALGAEALGPLIWFLPLALFFTAWQEVAEYRVARLGSFRLFGIATVIQVFLINLARVLGGFVAPIAGVLVAVTSIAPSVQVALLSVGRHRKKGTSPPLQLSDALALLRKHRDFPLYRVPTDVLNAASQSVPVILLTALFSPTAAGLYSLTRTALNLPMNVIGTSIGNVIYARFAELARVGQPLSPLLFRTTLALLALAPPIVGLAWFAPPLFAFAFGEEWREAGYFARWMALWIALMIANVPSMRAVPVINRQGLSMVYNIALLVVRILSVLIASWLTGSALAAVAWFSVSSSVMIVIGIIMFSRCVMTFDRDRRRLGNE